MVIYCKVCEMKGYYQDPVKGELYCSCDIGAIRRERDFRAGNKLACAAAK